MRLPVDLQAVLFATKSFLPSPDVAASLVSRASGASAATTFDLSSIGSYGGQYQQAAIHPNALGVSIESQKFPQWYGVAKVRNCLWHIGNAFGRLPPMRVGGNTADLSSYNQDQTVPVRVKADGSWSMGPSFLELAGNYSGQVIMNFNRKSNNLKNAAIGIRAALEDYKLYLVEVGNEPDLYKATDPIVKQNGGVWKPANDYQSQSSWHQQLANMLSLPTAIQRFISAGSYASVNNGWDSGDLSSAEARNNTAKYVKSYNAHGYYASGCAGRPAITIPQLMTHSKIVSWARQRYGNDSSTVKKNNPESEYWIAETNSISCGGGGISSTFGAALWTMNYAIQASLIGASRIFFHQGGLYCAYCWFTNDFVKAPYYGAYIAALALGGSESVTMLDDGTTNYGAYYFKAAPKDPKLRTYLGGRDKMIFYNSDYYTITSSATRTQHEFKVTGLPADLQCIKGIRLTAGGADETVESGNSTINIGRFTFDNGSCDHSQPNWETFIVNQGSASVQVKASEALLVYLNCDLVDSAW